MSSIDEQIQQLEYDACACASDAGAVQRYTESHIALIRAADALDAKLAAAEKRVKVLEAERDAAQLSADNNADKAAQLLVWRDTLINFVDQWRQLQKWNDGTGTPYTEGKASAYEHCAAGIEARFDAVRRELQARAALADKGAS